MDRQITGNPNRRIFKEFEYPDLIPYSVALFMAWGFIYLVMNFPHIRY
ncbi:MAG TPA: hypothetical protein VIM55_13100 [Mucilaginibacter sp.]